MNVPRISRLSGKRQTEFFLALIIILAAALRFWDITALGLWPSDAGTYVRMSTWILGAGGIPMDWEPPMYPISVAAAFMLFGIHDYVAVGTAAAFGVLTVLLVFLLGRKVFDAKTGLIASLFLAVTELHIFFSRVALADIAATFFYTLFFMSFYAAFRRKSLQSYALSGICLGLAFWTKYLAFLCFGAAFIFTVLLYAWKYYSAGRRKFPLGDMLADAKGLLVLTTTAAVMYIPWIFVIGIGSYMSQGHALHFSLADVDAGWVISNCGAIMQYGIREIFFVFAHNYSDGISVENDPAFYMTALNVWVSPIILLLILLSFAGPGHRKGRLFMATWLLTFLLFITFFISHKGTRLLLPAMPALAVLAGKGFWDLQELGKRRHVKTKILTARKLLHILPKRVNARHIMVVILALAILTGIYSSLDTIGSLHDGYRNVGLYINENVSAQDRIFYTGMPQLLFYHETGTGSYWDYEDRNGTSGITVVILDNHKYRDNLRFFDHESFERDFQPVAVFKNHVLPEQAEDFMGSNPQDFDEIRIYRPGEDISDYFHWSGFA